MGCVGVCGVDNMFGEDVSAGSSNKVVGRMVFRGGNREDRCRGIKRKIGVSRKKTVEDGGYEAIGPEGAGGVGYCATGRRKWI